jgi:flagellar FliL protein
MAKTEAVSTTTSPSGADATVPVASMKSKKKLVILLVATILLLSSIGAAAWWFLKPAPKKHADEADKSKISKSESAKLPIFVALEPFTVNLADADYDRFLHVVIQLEVKDDKVSGLLKTYDPVIRHRFLFLMSTANSEVLKTPEGKHALAQQLTLVANQILRGAPGSEGADLVIGTSFTTFMIQ